MRMQRIKWGLLGGIVLPLLFQVPLIMGQAANQPNMATAATSARNIFSIWTKLSLVGYSQSEIEAALQDVDEALLGKVKHQMRRNVIRNLRRMRLKEEIARSTTTQDLRLVNDKIWTEIRFAGLENDRHLQVMIRKHFGVSLIHT